MNSGIRIAIVRTTIAFALFVCVILLEGASPAQDRQSGSPARPAAKVGNEVISLQELEKELAPQLAKLEEQRYSFLQKKLDEMIGERLLRQEATRRGITVGELFASEVESRAQRVKEEDIAAYVEKNRGSLRGDDAVFRKRVRDELWTQRLAQQRTAFIESLRKVTPTAVLLEEPTPYRVKVAGDGAFSRGNKDAPITIVEFSDFECPFCRRALPVMREVMKQYGAKVKWVYRDFPLVSIHPLAAKAAEAARCAGEGGKFWQYHDLIFDSPTKPSEADLMTFGEQIGLDVNAFRACLRSGKYQGAVEADVEEGRRLGVTGTPTFFINGRSLVGAQALSAFQDIIESELRLAPKSGS